MYNVRMNTSFSKPGNSKLKVYKINTDIARPDRLIEIWPFDAPGSPDELSRCHSNGRAGECNAPALIDICISELPIPGAGERFPSEVTLFIVLARFLGDRH